MVGMLFGCSEPSEEPASSTGQSIPPLGAANQQTAPLSLIVRVDLAAIRDQISPDAKVFVFVREAGERMPLGVEQFTVADLPPTVEFTTQNSYSTVSVIARVSPSGKVEKSADDFEATAAANFAHPAQEVELSFATATKGQPTAAPASNGSIEVNITMAVPEVELSQFSEHSRVFIIAKAPGNPIPLAVKAYPVDAVPKHLILSDKDAMMPSRPLSSAQTVAISARISRSGDVSRAPGDWEGLAAQPESTNPNQYNIRIDQRVN